MSAVIMWPRRSRSVSYGATVVLVKRLTALILITVFSNCCSPDRISAAVDRPVKIVVLGDSLSAGFGLPPWDADFPTRLEQVLKDKGIAVAIANAGIFGDTASDGLARLELWIPEGTDAVILELGANDAEHGVNPNVTKAALDTIIRWLKNRRIEVLLTGMRAPSSMGPEYVRAFDEIFPALASTYSLVLYPFILDGVAVNPRLIQIDGEHPNAGGVNVIVERILPRVEELIRRVHAARRP